MVKIPVVLTFDKRIILAGAVAIQSLIDNAQNDTTYDIKILHSDISLKTQAEFSKLTNNTRHSISFYYVDKSIFKGYKISSGSWQEVVYYRLLASEIITDDKAIYSDVDVFFKKDLKEIFNTDIDNYEIGAIKAEINSKNSICHKYFEENKNEFTYWSGFLLLNCKKLREEKYFEKFAKTAMDFKNRLKFFDLDVLNITCNYIKPLPLNYCTLEAIIEFNDYKKTKDYKYLSKVYSDNEIENAKNDPSIIHYAGELGKPWRRKKVPEYYQKTIQKLPKSLQKYTFRDLRKKFFKKEVKC